MASTPTTDPIHLIHITDTHLFASAKSTLLKMNTMVSLNRVIDCISENEQGIDHVLATGDISQDGSAKSYEHFIHAVKKLGMPFSWLPGNHDNTSVMEEMTTDCGAGEKQIQLGSWQIIMLNTTVTDQVHGYLAEQELAMLASVLTAAEQNPAISHCLICLHHNPLPGSAEWMHDIGLRNSDALFSIIRQSDLVRGLVYGHIHQDLDQLHENIRCICTPSTCIQFKPHASNFELDENSPGYRSLRLFADGRIESKVLRISADENLADLTSGGY